MRKKVKSCSGCPFIKPGGSSFYCLLAKREIVIATSMWPKWCPLEKEDYVITLVKD